MGVLDYLISRNGIYQQNKILQLLFFLYFKEGPGGSITTHTSLSPIWRGFAPDFANYKKGCTGLAAARDKVYQLLSHGQWFSPGTPASFTTKTGRHDIAEILLKVALNTQKNNSKKYIF